MMHTLKHRRSRAAMVIGGITLLAGLTVAAAPAEAAVPAQAQAQAAAQTAVPARQGGPAAADATTTLPGIKTRSASEIARRQAALAARLTMVTSGSPNLTAADRTALTTLITNDQAGLTALGTKIAADTDLATAKADHQQIFTGYRVFALALPQSRLVRANDALITVALPRLTDAQTRLVTALAKAGKTDEAAAKMADLQTQIAAIRTNTDGLSAKVLGLTPAQWNADHTMLAAPRQSLASSRTALQKARADIVAVKAMLQS
jgi:hypothetical protein